MWSRIRQQCLIVILGICPVQALAEDTVALSAAESDSQLLQVEQAIAAGRLVQADSMLRWLYPRASPEYSSRVTLLSAEYYMAVGDHAAATSTLETVDANAADPCKFGGVAGWLAYRQREWNKAITMLAKSLDSCPDDPGRWNLLGLAMMKKGEFVASIDAFTIALGLLPDHPSLLNNRALAHAYLGLPAEAMADLEHAASAAGSDLIIYQNLSVLRAHAGLAPPLTGGEDNGVRAAILTKAGDGAGAADDHESARAYYAKALLLLDRFDRQLWSQAVPDEPASDDQYR